MRVSGATPLLAALLACPTAGQSPGGAPPAAHRQELPIVFMEPAADAGDRPVFEVVTDPERLALYREWARNPWARWAADQYLDAVGIAAQRWPSELPPTLYIALVPGGNHADGGFTIVSASDSVSYERVPYVRLEPQPWRFRTTLLHETGHTVLRALNLGQPIPSAPLAAIPHSTPALTDRGTAFDEGYAIHLETLLAHLATDEATREFYDRGGRSFGRHPEFDAEFYAPARDLLTFAQTFGRYADVRDNRFAFASAFHDQPDYVRVQLDPARDFSVLREPNQLLQSEGFYATFFFGLLTRGEARPATGLVRERQREILAVLSAMLEETEPEPATPHLVRFVQTYRRAYPEAGASAIDVLLDLSHGVFLESGAADRWNRFYLGALGLDRQRMEANAIEDARTAWRAKALADPTVLSVRLGPQIRCEVATARVRLPGLDLDVPLSFDANTVQQGVLELVPGLSGEAVKQWIEVRRTTPFRDAADLRRRVAGSGNGGDLVCDERSASPGG